MITIKILKYIHEINQLMMSDFYNRNKTYIGTL